MNQLTHLHELVTLDGAQQLTDSRVLARSFGKRHGNVLRAYDGLKCSAEFGRLNFEPIDYLDEQDKTCRFVKMTKDGFTVLAMASPRRA